MTTNCYFVVTGSMVTRSKFYIFPNGSDKLSSLRLIIMRRLYTFIVLVALIVTFFTLFYPNDGSPYPLLFDKIGNHTRIVFMETSEKGMLSLRQLVAVESAAFLNPEKDVVVYLFIDKQVAENSVMRTLREKYTNIRYEFIRMRDYVQGTLLEQWYNEGKWKTSKTPWAHTSDGLRLLELWKRGGIYFDLDVMTLKKLDFPKNALSWENDIYISAGAMAFQKRHPLILLALKEYVDHYNPDIYVINGPPLITKLYQRHGKEFGASCVIELLPMRTVTPVVWEYGYDLFNEEKATICIDKTAGSLALHWWNDLSSELNVSASSKCAFMILAEQKAPITWLEIQKSGTL